MIVDIQPITRTRGDTYPFTVTFVDDDGAVIDLTGASFVLTVNAEEDPTATQLPEFSLVGVVNDPLDGTIEFTMSEADADRFGLFYYDIQMTDVQGYVRTMMRGTFEMRQDITKNEYFWTAEGKTAVDGTDGIWLILSTAEDTWEYAMRDGVPVLRVGYTTSTSATRAVTPINWPRPDMESNFRLSGLQWMDESWYLSLWITSTPHNYFSGVFVSNAPDYRKAETSGVVDDVDQVITDLYNSGPDESWSAGWVQWVLEWDAVTGVFGVRAWQPPGESDPVAHDSQIIGAAPPEFFSSVDVMWFLKPEGPPVNAEIAWLKYEVLP